MFFDNYEDFLGPLALSAVWVIALFSYCFVKNYECKKKEAEARSRHRAQQDLEWRRQLQTYPWLRQIIAQHERLEGQITMNMFWHNRIVHVEANDGQQTVVLEDAPSERERVNWKTEGF